MLLDLMYLIDMGYLVIFQAKQSLSKRHAKFNDDPLCLDLKILNAIKFCGIWEEVDG